MEIQVKYLLPTTHGSLHMIVFSDDPEDTNPHFVLMHPEVDIDSTVYVRIHSECLTGDLLKSTKCDCGEQLHESLRLISEKKGALIYLRQEGRGIGLINKLHAYNLQDQGLNTIDANLHLGFEADERHYDLAIQMLVALGIKEINLITNNPEKIKELDDSPIKLIDRVPLIIQPGERNKDYLNVKKELMGHML